MPKNYKILNTAIQHKYQILQLVDFSVLSEVQFLEYAHILCRSLRFIVCEGKPYQLQPPLSSARQHPSYGDCLDVKREYYQNCSVLGCVTQCSPSAAHSYEHFLQVQQIGFVTLGPFSGHA